MNTIYKAIVWYLILGIIALAIGVSIDRAVYANEMKNEGMWIEAMDKGMLEFYYVAEKFKKNPSEGKKCTQDIGAVAWAFAKIESNVGKSKAAELSKNWLSLHVSKNYDKWDGKSTVTLKSGEVLRKYNKVEDNIWDFMKIWKSSYGCGVDKAHVFYYLNGSAKAVGARLAHSEQYYKNFKKYLNEYKKVFKLK